jgi:hypothetical protein
MNKAEIIKSAGNVITNVQPVLIHLLIVKLVLTLIDWLHYPLNVHVKMDGLIKEGIIKYVGNVFTLVKLALDQIILVTPVNSLQIEWLLIIVHVKSVFMKQVLIMDV